MFENKRKYTRADTVVNGAFFSKDDNVFGEVMMTNFSRDGFKASFNRPVASGRTLQFGILYPDNIMPVFTTGKVVWVYAKRKDTTYCFDAGVKLQEVDSLKKQKVAEFDFMNWHLKQVADYARKKGYLAKRFPEQACQGIFFLPSIALLYLLAGGIVSFTNMKFALFYCISIILYIGCVLSYAVINLKREKKGLLSSEKLKAIFSIGTSIISTHISYGFFFIRGLFSGQSS